MKNTNNYLQIFWLVILCLALSVPQKAIGSLLITQKNTQEEEIKDIPKTEELTNNLENESNIINQTYLLIKLSDRRVYVYQNKEIKSSYPVAIGKKGWETPTGEFEIINIQYKPIWINPFTRKLTPPGPKNPMGLAWIGFWNDGKGQIGFHGTPDEKLIGKAVSHGCVRMKNQDVMKLYYIVFIGMKVKVVP
ncbi:MAG: L,D-transpeptidase [Sphaerospermopsis kisseleviana]